MSTLGPKEEQKNEKRAASSEKTGFRAILANLWAKITSAFSSLFASLRKLWGSKPAEPQTETPPPREDSKPASLEEPKKSEDSKPVSAEEPKKPEDSKPVSANPPANIPSPPARIEETTPPPAAIPTETQKTTPPIVTRDTKEEREKGPRYQEGQRLCREIQDILDQDEAKDTTKGKFQQLKEILPQYLENGTQSELVDSLIKELKTWQKDGINHLVTILKQESDRVSELWKEFNAKKTYYDLPLNIGTHHRVEELINKATELAGKRESYEMGYTKDLVKCIENLDSRAKTILFDLKPTRKNGPRVQEADKATSATKGFLLTDEYCKLLIMENIATDEEIHAIKIKIKLLEEIMEKYIDNATEAEQIDILTQEINTWRTAAVQKRDANKTPTDITSVEQYVSDLERNTNALLERWGRHFDLLDNNTSIGPVVSCKTEEAKELIRETRAQNFRIDEAKAREILFLNKRICEFLRTTEQALTSPPPAATLANPTANTMPPGGPALVSQPSMEERAKRIRAWEAALAYVPNPQKEYIIESMIQALDVLAIAKAEDFKSRHDLPTLQSAFSRIERKIQSGENGDSLMGEIGPLDYARNKFKGHSSQNKNKPQ